MFYVMLCVSFAFAAFAANIMFSSHKSLEGILDTQEFIKQLRHGELLATCFFAMSAILLIVVYVKG